MISSKDFFEISKNCNALTILAHPIKYLKNLKSFNTLQQVILRLKTLGLHGIEVYNNRQTEFEQQQLLEFTKKYNLIITGGSDFHAKIGCTEDKQLGQCLNKDLTIDKLTLKL